MPTGQYRWVYKHGSSQSTLTLVQVGGTDTMAVGALPLVYNSDLVRACRCETKLLPQDPQNFPKVDSGGAGRCTVCVKPVSALVCCANCFMINLPELYFDSFVFRPQQLHLHKAGTDKCFSTGSAVSETVAAWPDLVCVVSAVFTEDLETEQLHLTCDTLDGTTYDGYYTLETAAANDCSTKHLLRSRQTKTDGDGTNPSLRNWPQALTMHGETCRTPGSCDCDTLRFVFDGINQTVPPFIRETETPFCRMSPAGSTVGSRVGHSWPTAGNFTAVDPGSHIDGNGCRTLWVGSGNLADGFENFNFQRLGINSVLLTVSFIPAVLGAGCSAIYSAKYVCNDFNCEGSAFALVRDSQLVNFMSEVNLDTVTIWPAGIAVLGGSL